MTFTAFAFFTATVFLIGIMVCDQFLGGEE